VTGEGAVAAVERVLAQRADADDVLREVVDVLVADGGCRWAGILFVESGELVLGPQAGTPDDAARTSVPVVFHGDRVAELAADGCADPAALERVADLVAPYCLVGWDTGGVPWDETA
jgi:hypothetical protein